MKRLAGIAVVAAAAFALFWQLSAPRPRFATQDAARLEGGDAERGRLVFAAGDCASCHVTPGQPDRRLLGGGMSLPSPFGTLRPPNISPDPDVGIGRWRAVDLANAIMSGVSPDGEHYYPALPYTSYAGMSEIDVRDLMAFLRTLPPASQAAPSHELSFPFTVRRFIGLWKQLYFKPRNADRPAEEEPRLARGRYLVETLAHCAECHASRDVFGGVIEETRFAGGPNPAGVGFAPNITPTRLGGWTQQELARFLGTGRSPSGREVGGAMKGVITNLAQLPPEDRAAIAAYVTSLPPRATPSP